MSTGTTKSWSGSIDSLPGNTDWNNIQKAREAIKSILKQELGSDSVFFSFDGGIMTAYMTSAGRDHSAGGNANERRAAMFSLVKDLIKNSEYIYSAKNDIHSLKGLSLPADTEWDSFEAAADIGGRTVPIIFSVYTNSQDVRSKIYSIFADENGAVSRGTGLQQQVGQPSYGATTPKQSITDTAAKSKSENEQKQTWDDSFLKTLDNKLRKVDDALLTEAMRSKDPVQYVADNAYSAQAGRVKRYIEAVMRNPAMHQAKTQITRSEIFEHYRSGEYAANAGTLLFSLYADTDSAQTTLHDFAQSHGIGDTVSAERMLRGLATNYPDVIGYTSTLGLDTIDLKEKEQVQHQTWDNVENAAVEHFGTTDDFRTAGYILRDGRMLDFSGAHWLDGYDDAYISDWRRKNDIRQVDHEDIYEAFEQIDDSNAPSDAALTFIKRGNIRLVPETSGIELSEKTEPTAAQYAQIRAYIREIAANSKKYNSDQFIVDLTKDRTHHAGTLRYDGTLRPDRIINDIKHFYQTGEVRDTGMSAFYQTWENTVETDQQTLVNRTMTMAEAKRILDMTFNANNMRSYRGYKNAEEWLREEGPSEVAMYAENTENVINQFMNRIPELIDYDVTFEEVFEAYMNGTLTGKIARTANRMDTSKSTGYEDSRFYAPKNVTVTQQDLDTAMLRANGNSKEQVFAARKKILFAAHTADGLQSIGMQSKDLNKLLRQWSRYPSRARDLSIELNRGVANENQWTGLQNSSILSLVSVTDDDIRSMVKEIRGNSSEYQRNYIGRTMLALDTHINWSHLVFDFLNTGNASETALAYYEDAKREIVVGKRGSLNTVAHEMGHALDHLWERELFGGKSSQPLSENTFDVSEITSEEGRQFYHNFTVFMENLLKSSDITSNYEQRGTETFARFVARFTEWAEIQAGISSNFEQLHYKDRFTVAQYKEFVKLLQEKATLDAKRETSGQTQFQRWDDTSDDTAAERAGREMAYSRLQAENAILTETVTAMKKLTSKQDKTIAALQKRLQITKTPETRTSDARKLARTLIQENNSKADVDALAEQIKALGDYILQTETSQLSEDEIKNRARSIAREVIENATEQVGIEEDTARQIGEDIRGKKLSIDEAFLGELDGAGGYETFRKSLFGRLTLAKRTANTTEGRDGYSSVSQFYADMQSTYGEAYFPNAANEGEEVQILAQMLNASQPMEVNPYTQYMGEVTEDLANRIVMDAMNGVLRPTAPTTMDKQKARTKALQERIKELQAEDKLQQREAASLYHTIYDLSVALDKAESRYETLSKGSARRISQVQAEGRARTLEVKALERAKAAENIQALREHYQDMARRARQGRRNTASRNKIRKLINDLNARLARPSENRYVPRELVQLTIDVLDMIDMNTGRSTKVAEKLADIRAMYERYKSDERYAVVYDEVTAEMLSNLETQIRGTKLGDMNEQQLNAVYEALKSLNHVISKAVNIKIGEEEHNAFTLAKEMSTETREIPKAQTSWLKNKWLVSHLRADVMFKRFGGFKKNSTWSMIGRMLNDGQLKQTGIQMDLSRPFAGLINSRKGMEDFTGTNYFGKIQQDKLVDIGLKDADGNAILVTHDIMVGIYMDLHNEENRRHFIRGGKVIPDLQEFYDGKGGFNGKEKTAVGIAAQLSDLMHDLAEAKRGQYGEWAEQLQDQIDELLAEGEANADNVQASIEKQLTDFDREWIKATQQLMDQDSKRYLNDTTMEVYICKQYKHLLTIII